MVTITVGQRHTLTAQFQDALGHPVTNVDPGLLVWSVDDDSIVNLGPKTTTDLPQAFPLVVTGLFLSIEGISSGITNVTATYNNGNQTFINVTQVTVIVPPVSSIHVS